MESGMAKEGEVILSINPKVYPLDIVYTTAYLFTDKNYIYFDGSPEEEILIHIKPKETGPDGAVVSREFMNELINQGAHMIQYHRSVPLRNLILSKVLQPPPSPGKQNPHLEKTSKPWVDKGSENE